MEQKKTVLIVEDEKNIVDIIRFNLQRTGYNTLEAYDGEAGLAMAREKKPDLILLDVMMPKMMGFDVCRALRAEGDNVPVIILTAREEEEDKILGLEIGADDYIPKPIKPKLLLSRIQAILKRVAADKPASLVIDRERHLVIRDGERIELPRKEFALLALLASSPGKLFSREEIYSRIWGDTVVVGDRTIDVHVRKIRQKIGNGHISTVKGLGYKYEN